MAEVTIYIVVSGVETMPDGSSLYTASAITSEGKGICGCMGRKPDVALQSCERLTNTKAPSMLSRPYKIEYAELNSDAVQSALKKYLNRLP